MYQLYLGLALSRQVKEALNFCELIDLATCLWLRTFSKPATPISGYWLILTLACLFASSLNAGIVPNTDGRHADNATNDPFYVNTGDSFSYVQVFDDDMLVMNGGTFSNNPSPTYERSAIRMLDESRATINGGIVRDDDSSYFTRALYLQDRSRLTINGGTFRHEGKFSALLYASDSSYVEINAGDFHSEQSPSVATWFSGSVTINGGTFTSSSDRVVQSRGSGGLVKINGGIFAGPREGVYVSGGDVILSGGQFETDIDLFAFRGETELIALSASLDGVPLAAGPITASEGEIDLVWANGETELLSFRRRDVGEIRLTLIPEPSTFRLLSLAIAALHTFGRGKRRSLSLTQ